AWIGATAVALAAAHLGADPAHRRVLMAGVVALAVPLMAEGLLQYTYQHDLMVAEYESNRAEHHRRMNHDTRTIQKYERRLTQREPRGPFPFANLFATVSLSLGFGALALGWGLWRGGGPKPATLTSLAVGILSLGAMLLSGSKGAVIACAVAGAAIGAAAWTSQRVRLRKTVWVAAACGVIAVGFAAVLLRGAAGAPPTPAGERSLLFRSHYWSAAASMVEQKPWFGVGPGRFQHAYLQHKPPINPEEVADPHNVFVAWIATLGLGGAAWALWVWAMWIRSAVAAAGGSVADPSQEPEKTGEPDRRLVVGTVGALGAAFMLVYLLRFVLSISAELRLYTAAVLLLPLGGAVGAVAIWRRGLSDMPLHRARWIGVALAVLGVALTIGLYPTLGVWALGTIGALSVFWALSRGPAAKRPMQLGWMAAATAALLHGQIEMGLTDPMTAPLLWLVVALASAYQTAPDRADQKKVPRPVVGGLATALAVVWLSGLAFFVVPAASRAALLTHAGSAMADGKVHLAFESLQEAHQQAPGDERTTRLMMATMVREAGRLHEQGKTEPRDRWLDAADALLQAAIDRSPYPVQPRHARTEMHRWAARMIGGPWLRSAADAAEAELQDRPRSIEAHWIAGATALRAGRYGRATRFLERALKLNELAYLDPLQQMTEDQRRKTVRWLEAARNATGEGKTPTP
ncbi:MAG: O-antigen ligase family protein, partial [Phycisphaeraceae bacterium]|nr:O-antigen ligase family protein [Phycisphaeraceae bacterium]